MTRSFGSNSRQALVALTVAALVFETGVEVGSRAGGSDHGKHRLIGMMSRLPVRRRHIILGVVTVSESFGKMYRGMPLRFPPLDQPPPPSLFVSFCQRHRNKRAKLWWLSKKSHLQAGGNIQVTVIKLILTCPRNLPVSPKRANVLCHGSRPGGHRAMLTWDGSVVGKNVNDPRAL